MTEEKYATFEQFLELGHEGKVIAQTQYAAYWLLRGKLPERITYFRARLASIPTTNGRLRRWPIFIAPTAISSKPARRPRSPITPS